MQVSNANHTSSAGASNLGVGGLLYRLLPWIFAIFIAFVFLRYLPYKFANDSYLFQVLEDWSGVSWFEPHGRYLTGGVELLASILLFVPRLQVAGAALAFCTMSGAIFFHVFTPLGIDPYNDGAQLFMQAVGVWMTSAIILFIRRNEILPLLGYFLTDPQFVRD